MAEQPALGFAGLLRQLRVGARLTQEELAEAAGLSPRSVSDLERGINRTARKDTAESLAGALGLAEPVRPLFVAAARGRAPAEEVLAVAADAGMAGPPVVIGHSMGGFVALRAAGRYGAQLAGVVAVDSPVRDITPEERAARDQRAFGPLRVYPTREAAMARFRPIPDQPVLPYIARHVAATSIHAVPGGWSWKFDPRIFARHQLVPDLLTRLDCRVALFRAEYGLVSAQMSEVMYDRLGRLAPVIEIPAAAHHVMMDQPIALVTAIRTLLSDWDHSLPAAPRPAAG